MQTVIVEKEVPATKQVLTVGVAEDALALDPPADWSPVATWMISNMFDCLVWRGRVTHTGFEPVLAESWEVLDGKVTTEPDKGYYYFWATVNGNKVYVQTPIARTYIEEVIK